MQYFFISLAMRISLIGLVTIISIICTSCLWLKQSMGSSVGCHIDLDANPVEEILTFYSIDSRERSFSTLSEMLQKKESLIHQDSSSSYCGVGLIVNIDYVFPIDTLDYPIYRRSCEAELFKTLEGRSLDSLRALFMLMFPDEEFVDFLSSEAMLSKCWRVNLMFPSYPAHDPRFEARSHNIIIRIKANRVWNVSTKPENIRVLSH